MALNYIYHVYYNGKKVRHVFLLIMNNLRNNYAEIYSVCILTSDAERQLSQRCCHLAPQPIDRTKMAEPTRPNVY